MDLTNLQTIKDYLSGYEIRPTKNRGQNFLIDRGALDKIIKAADLRKDDLVVEVGPGIGVLTRELASRVKKVLAVELDRKLIKLLRNTSLKGLDNVELWENDILKVKNEELAARLGGDYKVVANLPYNITGVVLQKFLTFEPRPKEMVLMLQKEVAERITAKAGEMSILGVSVQLYGRPEIAAIVPSKSFYPAPAVDSAVVKISHISDDLITKNSLDEKKFWRLVKIGFSARRKQLQNNLMSGLKLSKEEVKNILIKAKLNPLIRAQDLTVEDWLKLTGIF